MFVLLPKMALPTGFKDLPIFFFMGPDQGGGDWQNKMYERVVHHAEARSLGDFVAAIPKRYSDVHPIHRHVAPNASKAFKYQLTWEREFIEQAALKAVAGCVAIWLPKESTRHPRADGEPYARDTRPEIGELRGWMRQYPWVRFVIGAEQGFPGLDVIERNFSYIQGGPFQMFDSLDDVARCIVRVAKRHLASSRRSK
jgi:hypothetical protein